MPAGQAGVVSLLSDDDEDDDVAAHNNNDNLRGRGAGSAGLLPETQPLTQDYHSQGAYSQATPHQAGDRPRRGSQGGITHVYDLSSPPRGQDQQQARDFGGARPERRGTPMDMAGSGRDGVDANERADDGDEVMHDVSDRNVAMLVEMGFDADQAARVSQQAHASPNPGALAPEPLTHSLSVPKPLNPQGRSSTAPWQAAHVTLTEDPPLASLLWA